MSDWKLWVNINNEVVHPNAPNGGGGPGYFKPATFSRGGAHLLGDIPHPFSPVGRNVYLDYKKKQQVLDVNAADQQALGDGLQTGGNTTQQEKYFRDRPPGIGQIEQTSCWAAALMMWIKSYGLQLKLGQGRDPEKQVDLINFYAFSWDENTKRNAPRIAPDGKPYLFPDKSLNAAEADRVHLRANPRFWAVSSCSRQFT